MSNVLVLMYHRVNDDFYDFRNLSVSTKRFKQHMLYIKNHYNIVSATDDFNHQNEDSVVVTFDDGHADFYYNAYPILEELQIPAINFVCTNQIDTGVEKWDDELERLLFSMDSYPEVFKLEDEVYSCTWKTRSWFDRLELYRSLHWLIRFRISPLKRDAWLTQLRNWLHATERGRIAKLSMSSKQIRAISKSKYISLGAHTVNHYSLPSRTFDEQYNEIADSVKCIKKITGLDIDVFSYPFGACDETTIKAVQKAGIKKAFIATGGICSSEKSNFLLPRINVENWNINIFSKKIREYL